MVIFLYNLYIFGSIIEPRYIQNHVTTNHVIKRLMCILFLFVGGYDGNDFLSTVECYNPDKDEWLDVTYMTCGRSGHGVAVGAEPLS